MTIIDEGIDLNEELRKKFKEVDSIMNRREELNNIINDATKELIVTGNINESYQKRYDELRAWCKAYIEDKNHQDVVYTFCKAIAINISEKSPKIKRLIYCRLRDNRLELREEIKRLKEDLSIDNYLLCNIENLLETYDWEQ